MLIYPALLLFPLHSMSWVDTDYKNGEIIEEEISYRQKFQSVLLKIEQGLEPDQSLNWLLFDAGLKGLVKSAKNQKDRSDRSLAVRTLPGVEMDAQNKGWAYLENGDPKKAIQFFEVALNANTGDGYRMRYNHYSLACAHAILKNEKKALENLQKAVENGLSNPSALENDCFDSVKETPKFQEILKKLRENQGDKGRKLD